MPLQLLNPKALSEISLLGVVSMIHSGLKKYHQAGWCHCLVLHKQSARHYLERIQCVLEDEDQLIQSFSHAHSLSFSSSGKLESF